MQQTNDGVNNSRELPKSIVIPPIRGEMAHLRPATCDDLQRMDELCAYDNASVITGKDSQSERSMAVSYTHLTLPTICSV